MPTLSPHGLSARLGFVVCMLASAGSSQSIPAQRVGNTQFVCAKPPCIIVRVDGLSKGSVSEIYGERSNPPAKPTTNNVRVSDGKFIYQLTCDIDNKGCVGPILGTEYQFLATPGDKPADLYDYEGEYPHHGKSVLLKRGNTTLGPYWMVAEMPAMPTSAFQKLIAECNEREQGLNENDCTKWLARRAWMREAGCPDPQAAVACRSFQQLLDAADPDLLDIFARLEHVYVCFHQQEDEFFGHWFSEPSEFHWRKAEADDQKVFGLQNGMLMQMGAPGVYYYDKGVQDENAHISELGIWSYLPTSADTTPSHLALVATSNDAEFRGKTFQIDITRVQASESYKSKDDRTIKHTLVVQRSTGRFAESYAEEPSGKIVLSYSGRCLVVPSATN